MKLRKIISTIKKHLDFTDLFEKPWHKSEIEIDKEHVMFIVGIFLAAIFGVAICVLAFLLIGN